MLCIFRLEGENGYVWKKAEAVLIAHCHMTHPEFFKRAFVLLERWVLGRLTPVAFAKNSAVGGGGGGRAARAGPTPPTTRLATWVWAGNPPQAVSQHTHTPCEVPQALRPPE